jgi:hypothetical protein
MPKNEATPRKNHDNAKLFAKHAFQRPGIVTASEAAQVSKLTGESHGTPFES